jgi:hypothetical protein
LIPSELADFISDAKRSLSQVLHRIGGILYSAADTLSQGDIYVLGLNPGGDGGPTIAQDLDALATKTDNCYLDESWENKIKRYNPGQAPLQLRLNWLINALGYDLRRVCASNIIFMKSRDARGLHYPGDADLCWPVHERILRVVRPKVILTFGNSFSLSPYAYLLQRLAASDHAMSSGHGSWKCRGFETKMDNRRLFVVGIPHLSRYSPIGRQAVVDWLKKGIES